MYIRACLKVSTNHSPNHNNVDKTLGCCLDSFRPQPLPFSCYRCPNTNRESVRSSSYSALDMPIRVGKKKSKTAQKPREPSIFFIHRINSQANALISTVRITHLVVHGKAQQDAPCIERKQEAIQTNKMVLHVLFRSYLNIYSYSVGQRT